MPRRTAVRRTDGSISSVVPGYVFLNVDELRTVVSGARIATPDEMAAELVNPGSAFVAVLDLVLEMRLGVQGRDGAGTAGADRQRRPR